jgi:putative heme-binding domain-containing protein
VDREYAIMLRTPRKVSGDVEYIWSALALAHTGNDRWYLEALGIGADKNWDRYLDKYLSMYQRTVTFDGKSKGEKDPKYKPIDIEGLQRGYRDIIWRSRAAKTPELLTTLVSSRGTPENELPRLMRAFDFQKDSDLKTESLVKLAFGTYDDPTRAKFITTEAISRLKNFDVNKNPKHAEALDKLLEQNKGTPSFVEMVGKFSASKRFPDLLAIAQKQPGEQIGIDSIRVLLDRDQVQLIQTALESKDAASAANTAQALAGAQHEKANALLVPIVLDAKQDLELRRQATRAVARTKSGALQLIQLAQEKKLSDDLKFAAGSAISTLPWTDIRMKAFDVFPVAKTKANLPIIPITDLVKQRGNAERGKVVFAKQGTCAKCHTVNGEGKNVGPDLSEIGKKLSREALFESILFPSASILHNYETWVIETKKGTSANGLLVSKTAEEISIKDTEAIVRTFKIAEVESITRSPISLMPADLHQLMSTQELVDMVEYLLTLKEARKTKSNDEARTK